MFKGMKALPKALIIAAPIVLAIWAYTQFAPKSEPKVEAPVPVQLTVVPAESDAVKRAGELAGQGVQAATQAAQQAPAPVAPSTNVTSGDAGMNALMNAGKK